MRAIVLHRLKVYNRETMMLREVAASGLQFGSWIQNDGIQFATIPIRSDTHLQEQPWPTDHTKCLVHRQRGGDRHDNVHRSAQQGDRFCGARKEGDVLHLLLASGLLCRRSHGCLRFHANDLGRIPCHGEGRLPTTRADIKDGLAHEVEALPYYLQYTRLIGERGEGVVDFGVVAIQDIPGVLNSLWILLHGKYLSGKNQGREQAPSAHRPKHVFSSARRHLWHGVPSIPPAIYTSIALPLGRRAQLRLARPLPLLGARLMNAHHRSWRG